ncbi:MAG: macro domain-containing protein [candidate division WOR-3 bacterium]|nr:MAG: macro domain-containing protein [candidate division WOR-3 bacterium]
MKEVVNGIVIECVAGNIAAQKDMAAIVNAANAQLKSGGGVAGAIHRAAGPDLERECIALAPIDPGEAVITGGYRLPNRHVIHCLGPVYGVDEPSAVLLANCYRNALRIAEQKKIDSIAFPAISTGAFGYPLESAVEIALKAILEVLPKLRYVRRIRFVLYDRKDLETCSTLFSLLLAEAKKM